MGAALQSNRGKALGSLAEDYVEKRSRASPDRAPEENRHGYTIDGFSEGRLDEWVEFHGITVRVHDIFPN